MANIQHNSSKIKLERIDLRTTTKIKNTLAHAAELVGMSMSTFLIEAAWEKAKALLHEQEVIDLTDRERERFLSLLESVPEPTAKLKSAMQSYAAKGKKK